MQHQGAAFLGATCLSLASVVQTPKHSDFYECICGCFQAKVSMLDNLLEIEVAYSLMKEHHAPEGEDPIDANYHSLKTDLEVSLVLWQLQ